MNKFKYVALALVGMMSSAYAGCPVRKFVCEKEGTFDAGREMQGPVGWMKGFVSVVTSKEGILNPDYGWNGDGCTDIKREYDAGMEFCKSRGGVKYTSIGPINVTADMVKEFASQAGQVIASSGLV